MFFKKKSIDNNLVKEDYITKLRTLTNELSAVPFEHTLKHNEFDTIVYKTVDKQSVGFGMGIYKNKNIAVQKAFMCKGTILPKHFHEEKEIIVVFEGELIIIREDKEKNYKKGDIVYFLPHENHVVMAKENTWMIGITIPASEGYPNAK